MTQVAEFQNALYGISFDVRNLFYEPTVEKEQFFRQWFDNYLETFTTDILQTTQDDLRKILLQANENGWTIDQTRKQIEATFNRYVELGYTPKLTEQELEWFTERLPQYRLENIARTESMKAAVSSTHNLYEAWGIVEQVEWLATMDNRVRPTHAAANGQVVRLGEPFEVGNYRMLHPLDGSLGAGPEEICNCRCTEFAVINV